MRTTVVRVTTRTLTGTFTVRTLIGTFTVRRLTMRFVVGILAPPFQGSSVGGYVSPSGNPQGHRVQLRTALQRPWDSRQWRSHKKTAPPNLAGAVDVSNSWVYDESSLADQSSPPEIAAFPRCFFFVGYYMFPYRALLRQLLVGQPLPDRALDQAIQPLHRVNLHVALVEPERKFIDVPAQVLHRDVVVGAV